MIEVIGVRFKNRGKVYYFSPNGMKAEEGQKVVVETAKGLELADCAQGNHYVLEGRVVEPLRPLVRLATADDLRVAEINKAREKEAFGICLKKIAAHKLEMKLVDVECSFEGTKILFFFTADGRVDFRELVKDLASVFRSRIELRQIGVRDEAKMLGGIGICGRPFCCSQFLDEFQPVSTKMAKLQSMSLNPAKISGSCGRLMCCLRYEQEAYEELTKNVPKNGAFVETRDGFGNVAQVNLLRQTVSVRLDNDRDNAVHTYPAAEVATVPGGRPKDGSEPVSTLVLPPEPEEKDEAPSDLFSSWIMPDMLPEMPQERESQPERPAPEQASEIGAAAGGRRRSSRRGRGGARPEGGEQPAKAEQGERGEGLGAPRRAGGQKRPQSEKPESGRGGGRGKPQEKKAAVRPAGEKRHAQKPQGERPAEKKPQGERPAQPRRAPEEKKSRPAQPRRSETRTEQAAAPAPAAEGKAGEAKKSGSSRRRHYYGRSRGGRDGGPKTPPAAT